jgi:hypothetical protein
MRVTPGVYQGMYLISSDIEVTRAELVDRGVEVSEPFHFGPEGQTPGLDPGRADYNSFVSSGVSNFSLFEPQTFRNEDAVQTVEEELHQQCEQGSGNCALQNRAVVIQIEPADNWFS